MPRKSEYILIVMLIAFFGIVGYNLPENPEGSLQANLTENVNTFATNIATEYNNATPAAGTVTTTDDLSQIAPAAGDVVMTPEEAEIRKAIEATQAPVPVAQ